MKSETAFTLYILRGDKTALTKAMAVVKLLPQAAALVRRDWHAPNIVATLATWRYNQLLDPNEMYDEYVIIIIEN